MARGRMLSKAISVNARIGSVSERAALLWFLSLPHTDRDGNISGDPWDLAAICCPNFTCFGAWSLTDVERARNELVSAGLWMIRTDQRGKEVVTVFRFREHQEGMKYGREAASKFQFAAEPVVNEQEVAELRAMPYSQYLLSGHWLALRLRALELAGDRCQLCNGQEDLHVHHRTYERRGREAISDLTVLCSTCHAEFHERIPAVDGGE